MSSLRFINRNRPTTQRSTSNNDSSIDNLSSELSNISINANNKFKHGYNGKIIERNSPYKGRDCRIIEITGKIIKIKLSQPILGQKYVNVSPSDIIKKDNDNIEIVKGPFSSYTGKIISEIQPKVKVSIFTSYGSTLHTTNLNNIFFKDILLKNGNLFQVDVINNNNINGKEFVGNTIVPRIISINDIQQFLEGFKFINPNYKEDETDMSSNKDSLLIDDTTDDTGNTDLNTYSDSESESESNIIESEPRRRRRRNSLPKLYTPSEFLERNKNKFL